LMVVVGLLAVNLDTVLLKSPYIQQLYAKLSQQMGKLLQNRKSSFLIGMMNGLLPCGLVYFALFGAMASSSFTQGLLYMFLFGLGTFPLMLGTALAGQFISIKWRNQFKRLYPILFVLMGVLVIYKAANLNTVQGKAADNSAICLPQ